MVQLMMQCQVVASMMVGVNLLKVFRVNTIANNV